MRDPATPRNHLLRALPAAERSRLMALPEPVDLTLREVLHEAGEPIRHAHFVEEGVVSLLAIADGGQEVEVGLVGPEGMGRPPGAGHGGQREPRQPP